MNFVRLPLAKIGEIFGIEKVKIKDFKRVSTEKLKKRCKIDVIILRELIFKLIDFFKKHECGNFAYTIASQSFNAFRHKFMKHEIFIHNNPMACELERKSYYGGRNECFFIGKIPEKVYKLDVNSMYPYVMLNNKFPTKLVRFFNEEVDLKRFLKFMKKYLIIAEVTVKIKKPCIPVYMKEKGLCFPIGTFKTVLCSPELCLTLKYGKILKIHKFALYEGKEIFKDYVSYFYGLRKRYIKQKNDVFSLFTKIFLNSLYGKFGQKNEIWERSEKYDGLSEILGIKNGYHEFEDIDRKLVKVKFVNGKAFKFKGYYEFYNGFVAISSFVTSYARAYLFKLMEKAKTVYYVDTDSVFTNKEGYLNLHNNGLVNSYELGKLKLEEKGFIEIRGLKDYKFNDKGKIKGVKKNAKKIGKNKYEYRRFIGFKEALRFFDINSVFEIKEIKEVKREYKKGILIKVNESLFKVLPYVLSN